MRDSERQTVKVMRAGSGRGHRPVDPAVPAPTFHPESTEYRGLRTGNKRGNKSSVLLCGGKEVLRGMCAAHFNTYLRVL